MSCKGWLIRLARRRETADSEFVFPATRCDHITDRNLSRPLKEICLRLAAYGVDMASFTPHDLRRTVETGMAASRVPKEYRDRVLNHVDSSVGGQHRNQYDFLDEKREALEKWARRLEGLLTDTLATVVPMRERKRAPHHATRWIAMRRRQRSFRPTPRW